MKILLSFLFVLLSVVVMGQSVLPLRADTVLVEKTGGSGELKIKNNTRDSLGPLVNIGGGKTRFMRFKQINDTTFVVPPYGANDTIRITGGSGGGSSGISGLTVGRVVIPGSATTVTDDAGLLYDVATNKVTTDSLLAIKARLDTTHIQIINPSLTKTAHFFGTSVTQGYYTQNAAGNLDSSRRWSTYLCRKMGWTENNKGVASRTLQKRSPVVDNMIDALPTVPTYNAATDTALFLEFWINDITQQTINGSANYNTNNYITDYTTVLTSITGAKLWPASLVHIIASNYTDTALATQNTKLLQDSFFVATQTVSASFGVDYIDVYHTSFNERNHFLFQDGIHPSNVGHSIYGLKVANHIGATVLEDNQVLATNGPVEFQKFKFKQADSVNVNYEVVGLDQSNNAVKIPNGYWIENNPTVIQNGGINLNGYAYLYTNQINETQRENSGLSLQNAFPASLSIDQRSPQLLFGANYWNTDSVSSQPVKFRWDVFPFAGTGGTNRLQLMTSKNGGAYVDLFNITNNGATVNLSTSNGSLTTLQAGGSDFRMNVNGVYDVYGQNIMNFRFGGGSTYKYTLTAASLFGSGDIILQGTPAASSGYNVFESVSAAGIALSTAGGAFPILFAPNRTEKARINGSGEWQQNSTTDFGAYTIQNTGGLYQNGAFSLRSLPLGDTSMKILVRDNTPDSLVKYISLSSLAGGNGIYGGNGSLPSNVTVTSAVAGRNLNINGISEFADGPLLSVNTTGSVGIAIQGESTDGRGVQGIATSGNGLYGSVTSGYGLFSQATTGSGIYSQTNSGLILEGLLSSAGTNDVLPAESLSRSTSGAAAAGFGFSRAMYLQASTGTSRLSNEIITEWTTATDASRVSQLRITGVNAGTTGNKAIFKGSGQFQLPAYGSGTFTGTAVTSANFDASGNIIEGPVTTNAQTYVPTLTGVANVTGTTASTVYYRQSGDVVDVWGIVGIDPTAALTLTRLGFSLPVASTFSNSGILGGSGQSDTIAQGIAFKADTSNSRAEISFMATDDTSVSYYFKFTYKVTPP